MPSKWEELIVAALAGPIKIIVADQLSQVLMKIEPIEARQTILATLYPPIDVQLEDIVKKTKTPLDDIGVVSLKNALEQAAAQSDIELQNLDAGKPND